MVSCQESVASSDIDHPDIQKGNKYHIFSFADSGVGFPSDEAEKIFGMFYRLHEKNYKGSGIGLAICRKIMNIHGGFITAAGEPGKGATIHYYFPL